MQVTIEQLLARVRAHIDADEVAPGQWAPDSTLTVWLNTATIRLWRKLARAGRVTPTTTTLNASAATPLVIGGDPYVNQTDTYSEPLVIYGVSEVLTTGIRPLRCAQAGLGPIPYSIRNWGSGTPQVWWVTKNSSQLGGSVDPLNSGRYTINLSPTTTIGTYEVIWLPRPFDFVSPLLDNGDPGQTSALDIPAGMDEYLVLHAARMAFARGGAMPPSLAVMLQEMESELDIAGEMFLQGNGPRVINKDKELRGWARRGQEFNNQYDTDWWWAP